MFTTVALLASRERHRGGAHRKSDPSFTEELRPAALKTLNCPLACIPDWKGKVSFFTLESGHILAIKKAKLHRAPLTSENADMPTVTLNVDEESGTSI